MKRTVGVMFALMTCLSGMSALAVGDLATSLTISDPNPGAAGVVYVWEFTPQEPVLAEKVTLTMPPGWSGDPFIKVADGLENVQVAPTTGGLEATFTRAALNDHVILAIGGITNPDVSSHFKSEVELWASTDLVARGVAGADHLVTTPGTTRMMVIVTSDAAKIAREQAAPPDERPRQTSMINEQPAPPVQQLQTPSAFAGWSATDGFGAVAALALASSLVLLTLRRRVAFQVVG